jgi:Ca2+/Na+ antiporter
MGIGFFWEVSFFFVFLLVMLYVVLYFIIILRLKHKHKIVWEKLGKPGLASNNNRRVRKTVDAFAKDRNDHQLNDRLLTSSVILWLKMQVVPYISWGYLIVFVTYHFVKSRN